METINISQSSYWHTSTALLYCVRNEQEAMSRTVRIFACFLLIGLAESLDKYEEVCPNTYPQSCRCFPKSNWVKCENMRATTKFPRGVFNNDTKWLSIEKSSIKNITGDDFIGLQGLTRLDMTEGSLNFIQQGTFQQLSELTELKLTDNQLVSFSPGVFANLSKLGTVTLKDNGTKNFYWPDLSGSPMEYLISYFYLPTAYSCEEISK